MYNSFQLAEKYLHYYFTARNGRGHGMHSPFVFQFILDVLNNRQKFIAPTELEVLRRTLLKNNTPLIIEDLGAGSRKSLNQKRTVSSIAATAVKSKKWSNFLYRLVRMYRPNTIIELGTSLGLSTAHMAKANPEATIYTIEGSAEIYNQAVHNFNRLQLKNIRAIHSAFDDALPQLLQAINEVDLAFIDGNHRYEATMRYFKHLLLKSHDHTIFIFDDIHWSGEMEQAWAQIKGCPQVRCSIDLFFMGLVFIRPEFHEKQHFVIRF